MTAPLPGAPRAAVHCDWCGGFIPASVDRTRLMARDRYLRLEPHEDIYPTRACEGGNRVYYTWELTFLPREATEL